MHEIVVTRIFDAPRELVWKAWTDPDMLKRWWGPKGYSAPDAKMDVRVDGKYLFSMQGPDGKKLWGTGTYQEIVPMEKLVITDSFSDEDGNILEPTQFGMSTDFPKFSDTTVTFEEEDGKTRLTITTVAPSDAALEAMKKSGMEAGWNESLDKLAETIK